MKKYNIIYADPPWYFKTYSDEGRGRCADQHYKCMQLEDIKNLPVSSIAAEDSALFLWVPIPHLEYGLEVIKAWGFRYKTFGFVWVKGKIVDTELVTEYIPGNGKNIMGEYVPKPPQPKIKWHVGLGYWTRANAEINILATRGHPHRVSMAVRQVVFEQVGKHSAKPAEVRKRIVELMGDLPRVELFARERVDGWDAWGDEITSDKVFDTPKLEELHGVELWKSMQKNGRCTCPCHTLPDGRLAEGSCGLCMSFDG